MLFNSFGFLFFFPTVAVVFYWLPPRVRWLHLLLASCVFYMAFIPAYLLVLLFTIAVDYAAGLLIEDARGQRRRYYLALSLAANLGILAVFKYYDFFGDNLNAGLAALGVPAHLPLLRLVLPIGLSFHTFQAMSYTIEVYRGRQRAERHFGLYALYVLFFPQLVAGPIERPQQLLPQFRRVRAFDYARVASGLRLMGWGLFKKVVVADRLSVLVSAVYGAPSHFRGLPLLAATVFFAVQIYCDFSGYSDLAVGTARVLGFDLMRNFDRPYFARSIGEFWRRWHISLSRWFRDYVYRPLGGSQAGVARGYRNVLLVFLLSGLWHGANWTFLAWGALHGSYLVVGRLTRPARRALVEWLGLPLLHHPLPNQLATGALVTFAWIFFRANSLSDAGYVVRHLFDGAEAYWQGQQWTGLMAVKTFYTRSEWWALAGGLAVLVAVEVAQGRVPVGAWLPRQPAWLRWSLYGGLVGYIGLFGAFGDVQFIYFQF